MSKTLYELFKEQGKALPSTSQARFSDADFAGAAQRAGVSQQEYAVNSGNAALNSRIASQYSTGGATTPTSSVSGSAGGATVPPVNTIPANIQDFKYIADPNLKTVEEIKKNKEDTVKALRDGIDSQIAEFRRQREGKRAEIAGEYQKRGNIANAGQIRSGLAGSGYDTAQNETLYNEESKAQSTADSILNNQIYQAEAVGQGETSNISFKYDEQLNDLLKTKDTAKKSYLSGIGQILLSKGMQPTEENIKQIALQNGSTPEEILLSYQAAQEKKQISDLNVQQEQAKLGEINSRINKNNISAIPKSLSPTKTRGGISYSSEPSYVSGNKETANIMQQSNAIDPTIKAYANALLSKQTTLSSIPSNLRNQVVSAQGVLEKEKGVIVANQILKRLDGAIDMLNNPKKSSMLSGSIAGKSMYGLNPSTLNQDVANFRTILDGLRSASTIAAIPLMKGTGPLSNADMKILENSQTELNSTLDEETLLEKMTQLRNELEPARIGNKQGQTMQPQGGVYASPANQESVRVVSPEGVEGTIPLDQLEEARQSGYKEI